MTSLDKGRVSVAAGCVGLVQACLESSVSYAKERTQFGRQIAGFQLVQDMIADISLDADAARLLVWRAADLIDRGERLPGRGVQGQALRLRGRGARRQPLHPGLRRRRATSTSTPPRSTSATPA